MTRYGSSAQASAGGLDALMDRVGEPWITRNYRTDAVVPGTRSILSLPLPAYPAQMAAAVAAVAPGSYVTVKHEPVADIKAGTVSLADYRAANLALAQACQGTQVRPGLILDGYGATQDPAWVMSNILDAEMVAAISYVGFDRYNGKSASQNLEPAEMFGPLAQMAASVGLPWIVGEVGIPIEYDHGTAPNALGVKPGNYSDAALAAWYGRMRTYLEGLPNPPEVVCYWWSFNKPPTSPWDWNDYRFAPTPELSFTTSVLGAFPATCAFWADAFADSWADTPLRATRDSWRVQAAERKAERDAALAQNSTLVGQNQTLTAQLQTTVSQRNALQTQVSGLQAQIDTLTAQVSSLTATTSALQVERTQLQSQLTAAQTSATGLAADKAALQAQLADVRTQLAQVQAQVAAVTTERDNLAAELDALSADDQSTAALVAGLRAQVSGLQGDVLRLQAQLAAAQTPVVVGDVVTALAELV